MAKTPIVYDLRGLHCPLILLKIQKKLKTIPINEVLIVLSNDALAPIDVSLFCCQNHYDLTHTVQGDVFTFTIKKIVLA